LPRTTWAVDIITNMPKTDNGNTAIFIAIDMFTNYIQAIPIPTKSTKSIIKAIMDTIITPFGYFKILRCDNEAGIQNSTDFTQFATKYNFEILPTSSAAPWSNGAAERAVQTIKKALKAFSIHEQNIPNWDKNLHHIVIAHNNSIGKYGFSPEEIHFGFKKSSPTDLIQTFSDDLTQEEYMEFILSKAEDSRKQMRERSDKQMNEKMTQRNKHRLQKQFKEGDVVIQRQTQLAVGPHSAMQTKFTGPYVIKKINENKSSAVIENLQTRRTTNAHFQWLQKYKFNPRLNRLPQSFEDDLQTQFPSQDSDINVRISSPPIRQQDPDNNDGADDFDDDTQMFHKFKSQQARRRRQLQLHTQTQQTQTTPPVDATINDSSQQTQQIDSQLIDEDDLVHTVPQTQEINEDDDPMDFGPPGDSQLIETQQPTQPVSQPQIENFNDDTQDYQFDDIIQPDDIPPTLPETQLIEPSQSQLPPTQQVLPRKTRKRSKKTSSDIVTQKKSKVIVSKDNQLKVDKIDTRNTDTQKDSISDEIDVTQPTTNQQQPEVQQHPYQQLNDEFSSQQPTTSNLLPQKVNVKLYSDTDSDTIVDNIVKKPPRAKKPKTVKPPSTKTPHTYNTRSKSKPS